MPKKTIPTSDDGTFKRVLTPEGVNYEPTEQPKPQGVAFVEPQKSKDRRQLEMEAGAARVAYAAEQMRTRPPRIISDKEKMAEGFNMPVFRPNSYLADRVTKVDGVAVPQQIGALMRKMGGQPKPEEPNK